jgi:hypothetical protein
MQETTDPLIWTSLDFTRKEPHRLLNEAVSNIFKLEVMTSSSFGPQS